MSIALAVLLIVIQAVYLGAAATEVVEAQLLRVGRELRGETLLTPGFKTYLLSGDGLLPHEAVEIRISHLSLPPAKFSFTLKSFPDDGSIQLKRRTKKPASRLRRRLDTAITSITTGKSGALMVDGKESQKTVLIVSAVPMGFRPQTGPETSVEVRFNIIMERKILNNAIPETASRMIMFAGVSLLVSTIVIVPMVSAALRRGDEIISRDHRSEASKRAT